MSYCSLEEAWGENFTNQNNIHESNINTNHIPQVHTKIPDDTIPSYSGPPLVNNTSKARSKIVPYEVKFPDQASRNFTHPISQEEEDNSDNDSALDILDDDDRDMRFIDKQRKVIPEYEPNYLTSNDYFLYKKYLNLAEKYKKKLKKKYKTFREENPNILEGFSNQIPNNDYNAKDILIIIIVGIFLIFALDIFVKLGSNLKKNS